MGLGMGLWKEIGLGREISLGMNMGWEKGCGGR